MQLYGASFLSKQETSSLPIATAVLGWVELYIGLVPSVASMKTCFAMARALVPLKGLVSFVYLFLSLSKWKQLPPPRQLTLEAGDFIKNSQFESSPCSF